MSWSDLSNPTFLDWIQAGGTLVAVAVAVGALYQVQRSRRWEDRSLLVERVYSPLHKALTGDRDEIRGYAQEYVLLRAGKALIAGLRNAGMWERIPKELRAQLTWLYEPGLDDGKRSHLDSDEACQAIRCALIDFLRPIIAGAPDRDLHPTHGFLGETRYGVKYEPEDFLRCRSLQDKVSTCADGDCGAPDSIEKAVAAPPLERGYRGRLLGACEDYLHFEDTGERNLKVAVHELRWRGIEPAQFALELASQIELVPEVQRWRRQRESVLEKLESTLKSLRRRIHDPS